MKTSRMSSGLRDGGRYEVVCHGSVSRVVKIQRTADTAVAHYDLVCHRLQSVDQGSVHQLRQPAEAGCNHIHSHRNPPTEVGGKQLRACVSPGPGVAT